ncbi:hypothetical protein JKP88DRAFT_274937 [Tribonema minus]|uniref:Uncharacterized protein n=1 Tax=Tribonema minus TaxID=303371 RepID=A0A835ZGX2_9STRA|nr:hypothetical protein JKP88DRAFT_274937 [Tribonema minus]
MAEREPMCMGSSAAADHPVLTLASHILAFLPPSIMEVCSAAAEAGDLEVLQWAHANGCPWDQETCSGAASEGHLEILQWARANGCPWDKVTCSRAQEGGNQEVLDWAPNRQRRQYAMADVMGKLKNGLLENLTGQGPIEQIYAGHVNPFGPDQREPARTHAARGLHLPHFRHSRSFH